MTRVRRRLTALLVAVLVGTGGAVAVVGPAQAVGTCTLTIKSTPWPNATTPARWIVEAKLSNTGATSSTNWLTLIRFPYAAGAVVQQFWTTTKSGTAGTLWRPVAWNKVIPAGGYTTFGFEVTTPSWEILPAPATGSCSLTY